VVTGTALVADPDEPGADESAVEVPAVEGTAVVVTAVDGAGADEDGADGMGLSTAEPSAAGRSEKLLQADTPSRTTATGRTRVHRSRGGHTRRPSCPDSECVPDGTPFLPSRVSARHA
jgi:hypothetical protein